MLFRCIISLSCLVNSSRKTVIFAPIFFSAAAFCSLIFSISADSLLSESAIVTCDLLIDSTSVCIADRFLFSDEMDVMMSAYVFFSPSMSRLTSNSVFCTDSFSAFICSVCLKSISSNLPLSALISALIEEISSASIARSFDRVSIFSEVAENFEFVVSSIVLRRSAIALVVAYRSPST